LNSKTNHTLGHIFQHPITHNLEWRDIRGLFETLGEVEHEHNGNLKVTLHGNTTVFHSPADSNVATVEEITKIRHFLHESGVSESKETSPVLLVIDHREARIFHTGQSDTLADVLKPSDPQGHEGHVHSVQAFVDHQGNPHRETFFRAIAKSLEAADEIIIFGSGTGSSSERELFGTWLAEHEPRLAAKIVASDVVDESHMTDGQLLAKAREVGKRRMTNDEPRMTNDE
jgi:hypothetical protein